MYLAIFPLLVHIGKMLIISVMVQIGAKSSVYKALVLPAKFFICQGTLYTATQAVGHAEVSRIMC